MGVCKGKDRELPGRGGGSRFQSVEDLELLPHLAGVEEVHEGALGRVGGGGRGGEAGGDMFAGVVHEKTFLRNDLRGGAAFGGEGGGEPVPTHVGGEILFAGAGEEVVVLGVLVVGAGGAGGRGMAELGEGFSVVEGQEKSVPGLGGEFAGEDGGGKRGVETVVLRRVGDGREKIEDVGGGGA